MSPKLIDKEQRKKEIALVALDLFAEKGFETTSISSVAEAAGIGKGTVYEYFISKEELFFCGLLAWCEEMAQGMTELFCTIKDPEELMRKYVHAMMEAYVYDPRTVKIMLSIFQIMLKNDEMIPQNQLFRKMFDAIRKSLVDILLEGVSNGYFKPEIAKDAETIVINLFAYLDGIGFHYLMNTEGVDWEKQVDFYLDRLFQTILL
jgi:AcrR family transcriptional regulator